MKDPLDKLYQYFYAQAQVFKDKEQHKIFLSGFVTISRQAGAGGVTVGEKLAHDLNEVLPSACSWTVFDNTLVNEVIRDHNFPERMKTYLKEACLPGVEDWLEEILGVHPVQSTLVDRTSYTIRHLAKMGRCIIVGRGSSVITRYIPGGIHVRLVAGPKNRKEHLKKYFKFNDKEAEKFMTDEDHGRAEYLKKYFDCNIDDPLLYDLVINTDSVPYDEAAVLIRDMVVRKIKSEELSSI